MASKKSAKLVGSVMYGVVHDDGSFGCFEPTLEKLLETYDESGLTEARIVQMEILGIGKLAKSKPTIDFE